jgi:hypothetical protein
MNDLGTICLVAALVAVVALLIPRLIGGLGRPDYSRRGDESPRYDDPDIGSRGSFGGRSPTRPNRPSASGPRYNNPNIRSKGSFGRSKD